MTTLDHVNATVRYEEILRDTDLEYIVSGVNIKENIIVKNRQDSYRYSFEMCLNNLTAELTEKGEIQIFNSSAAQPVYLIPAPVMWDSARSASEAVCYELSNHGILSKYSGDSESSKCRIEFNESAAKITNSYKVTSRYDRQKISEIIRRTGLTNREYDNMSAEWLGHNICYTLHIKRQSTKDVDIDYDGDERFYVRAGAKALEILGWD